MRAASSLRVFGSADALAAKVAAECFGNADGAVGLLMRFDEGDEEARERGAGAVERVAEAVFAVFIFVAQVHNKSPLFPNKSFLRHLVTYIFHFLIRN